MTSFNEYHKIDEQLVEKCSKSIFYFARETPELWLRQYLTMDEEFRPFEDQKFPDFGFDFYEKMRDLIYNFINEGKEMQCLIIDLIENFQLEEEEWNEQLKVIKVDKLEYLEIFMRKITVLSTFRNYIMT